MSTGRRCHAKRRIAVFAVSQLVSYGSLYYSFGALLPWVARDLDVPTSTAAIAFSAATISSIGTSLAVGIRLHRSSPAPLAWLGTVAGSAGLLGWSQIETLGGLIACWVLIGLAGPFVFYDVAFVAATRIVEPDQRTKALSIITIVGGCASTLYIPASGLLAASLGWRTAVLVMAAVFAGAGAMFALSTRRVPLASAERRREADPHAPDLRCRGGVRLGLTLATVGPSMIAGAVAVLLLTLLMELGHTLTTALAVASLLGVSAVLARVAVVPLLTSPGAVSIVLGAAYLMQALALIGMTSWGAEVGVAAAATCILGAVIGLGSLARPLLVIDYLGAPRLGIESGWLTAANTAARGAGPVVVGVLSASDIGAGLLLLAPALVLGALALFALRFNL